MPVEFVLLILGIAKPSLASLPVQLFHREGGVTVLCIWKEHFFHVICPDLSGCVKNWLIKSFIYSFIHSFIRMNESRIFTVTWGPWLGTKWGIRAQFLAQLGSGRVLWWDDILDQVFWDRRVVGLGCSQTRVSFGYPSISRHVPRFQTLFPCPSVSRKSFWEGEQQKVVSQLLCATR